MMIDRKLPTTRAHLLVALLLGLAATLVWTIGVFDIGSSQGRPAEIDLRTGLLTTNRSSLKLCVNSEVAAVSNAALQAVTQTALTRIATHPRFAADGFARSAPLVEAGCPGSARIAEPGFDPRGGYSDHGGIVVNQPTQYRTYVYVVSDGQLAPLAGYGHQRVPREVYCPPSSPDDCAAVSTAVYLTPGDLSDSNKLVREIMGALGMNPDKLFAQP